LSGSCHRLAGDRKESLQQIGIETGLIQHLFDLANFSAFVNAP